MAKIFYLMTEAGSGGAERVVLDLSVDIKKHREYDVFAAALDGRGIYSERFRKAGIPFFDLKAYKSKLSAALNLRKLVSKIKPDIVHSHLYHANAAAKICLAGMPVKIITTCHIAEKRNLPFRYLFDRLTAFLAESEVCVSNAVKKHQISKTGLKENHFNVIHNGIDLHKFKKFKNISALKKKFNIPENLPTIGFLGRFSFQKGADIFIKALADKTLADCEFSGILGGFGSEENTLHKLTADLEDPKRPLFAGEIDKPEEFMPVLDICVIPSRWEGFGLTAVEAMASGCAVIAAKIDSLPEIITDRQTGILFEPENHSELAARIKELLTDKKLRNKLAAAGQAYSEKFSLAKMTDKYINLYDKIIAK